MARATRYLDEVHSVGAYMESQGITSVREEIAQFLNERDGYPANPANIFLTEGASAGVKAILQTIIRDRITGFKDAILAPIPQYPLYSGSTALFNGTLHPYFLNEEEGWSLSVAELEKSLRIAIDGGLCPRALVVINPGNPTGQILSEENVRQVAQWCRENSIVLMADEVYQENIWKDGGRLMSFLPLCPSFSTPLRRFNSFRKAAFDLDLFSGENPLQLVSFHRSLLLSSTSPLTSCSVFRKDS